MRNPTAKVQIHSQNTSHTSLITYTHHTQTECYEKLQKTMEVLSILPKGGGKASKKRKAATSVRGGGSDGSTSGGGDGGDSVGGRNAWW